MLSRGGQQRVAVRVLDCTGRGVPGLSCTLIVHEAQGKRGLTTPPTDAQGYTEIAFPVNASPPGYRVLIEALALWQGYELRGQTSYIICGLRNPSSP